MAPETETTNADARQAIIDDPSKASEYTGETAPDTIKGWNDRRKSNNQIISGLTPFVQMIGLFNPEEYENMFGAGMEKREVWITDAGGHDIPINRPYIAPPLLDAMGEEVKSPAEWIQDKLKDRFINIYMVDQIDTGLSVAPMDGIMMAQRISQIDDISGGVGITDLQVDYGKSNIMGSRKFVVRMTVNDPLILDDHPEYAKLATMGGEFLIIYGWSNPKSIPGYSATVAPPLIEQDPTDSTGETEMMVVPLKNLGNGGYWSAGRVRISSYDFSFNPMGQLEISVTLRDKATLGLISTRVSSISPMFRKLMGTGDSTDDKNFINMIITGSGGRTITIKDQVMLEQQKLIAGGASQAEAEAAIAANPQQIAESGVEIADLGAQNEPLSNIMEKWNDNNLSYFENAGAASNLEAYEQKKQSESMGFPNALGISVYEKYKKRIKIPAAAGTSEETSTVLTGEENQDYVSIDDYKVKTVYYYLGWVMEGIRLSLSDANRGRQVEGEPIFNPKFFYTDNSNDSQLTSAFQKTIPQQNRNASMEERIQQAIIRLKENCMPPSPPTRGLSVEFQGAIASAQGRLSEGKLDSSPWKDNKIVIPCGGLPVIAGKSDKIKMELVNAIFPFPPEALTMASVPYRGFLIRINPTDDQYSDVLAKAVERKNLSSDWRGYLDKKNREDADDFRLITLFKPDWYSETIAENEIFITSDDGVTLQPHLEVPAGGSPDGYDPNNPEAYMSKTRGGRFYYLVRFDARSAVGNFAAGRSRFGNRIMGSLLNRFEENIFNIIMTVNEYRRSDPEIWEMTQRRWHNLYVRFLGIHFERMIRARIQELTAEGRTVEEIYDEPVDLDYLTGKVFRNTVFSKGTDKWPRTYPWVLKAYKAEPDNELIELTSDKGLPARIRELSAKRGDIEGKLTKIEADGIEFSTKLNVIRNKIEDICGGKYERELVETVQLPDGTWALAGEKGAPSNTDSLGNPLLSDFKNWKYIIQGNKWVPKSGLQRLPDRQTGNRHGPEVNIDVWQAVEVYQKGWPTVLLDWVIWKFFSFPQVVSIGTNKIPTDNFWWADYADVLSNISITDGGERNGSTIAGQRVDFHGVPGNNLQSLWIQQNPTEYEGAKQKKDELEAELKIQIGLESVQVKKLSRLYIEHRDYQLGIENIDNIIAEIQDQISTYEDLFRTDGKIKELTPYDDTSDIDTPISIPMGREHPMVLTTKVAYQFYKRFMGSSGLYKQGVLDVMNYGPAAGGTQYQRPSNTMEFKFRPERAYAPVLSNPRMILDPEQMQALASMNGTRDPTAWRVALSFTDLSAGAPTGDQTVANRAGTDSPTYGNESVNNGRWIQWGAFGTPGTPNEPLESPRNEYGFKPGPPRTEEEGELGGRGETGGTNVGDYGDFLDIFGLKYNPKHLNVLRIIGSWPKPKPEDRDDAGDPLLFYNMIDDSNNIIQPDGQGWFITSGWILDYGGPPVYLYPDVDHALKINRDTGDIEIGPGYPGLIGTGWLEYGSTRKGQLGNRNSIYRGTVDGGGDNGSENDTEHTATQGVKPHYARWAERVRVEQEDAQRSLRSLRGAGGGGGVRGALRGLRSLGGGLFGGMKRSRRVIGRPATYYTNGMGIPYVAEDAEKYRPSNVTKREYAYGPRLDEDDHNMNLTIDEKRALVIRRGSTRKEFYALGTSMPAPWGRDHLNDTIGPPDETDRTMDNWSGVITKGGGEFYYYIKDWDGKKAKGSDGRPADYVEYGNMENVEHKVNGKTFNISTPFIDENGSSGGVAKWPQERRWRAFTNKDYPYGTGFYKRSDFIYGSYVQPELNKNYTYWGDFLFGLPGSGFFTDVNNEDNSPTKILPDGTIVDGSELNEGFVQFIIQNVFAPLPKNRRIGSRQDGSPLTIHSGDGSRMRDTCYGDLFASKPDEETGKGGKDISFADLTNLKIDNVADIPIRRDVVDNLMNKNNNSMSISSFFAEIFKPSSVGIQSAKVNIGARQRADGVFEIFQANKNWDIQARQMIDEYDELTQNLPDRYPPSFMLFDYKSSDSLIQNIDMSSKFDPMMALAFEHGAEAWTGSPDKVAKFLAYGNVAKELQIFLEEENPDYVGIIDVPEGTEEVKVDLKKLLGNAGDPSGIGRVVPQSTLTRFLMLKPERMQKLNALIQSEPGSNFATQLLAQYMTKTTITIHGTTNLFPFQKILIRGIIPDLEGLYLITNTRESIMAQDFQTIIDAVLIKPVSQVKNKDQAEEERQTSS